MKHLLILLLIMSCSSGYNHHFSQTMMDQSLPYSDEISLDLSKHGKYDHLPSNPFKLVENESFSTFSIDVDTASYSNMRSIINHGSRPPVGAIRTEELINYFSYNYEKENNEHPISISVDQSLSPWNQKRRLVRIGLATDKPSDQDKKSKNLVFLIDVSGSMSGDNKLGILKRTMKLLVKNLNEEDSISIVVYAGASGLVLEPTQITKGNQSEILRAISRLSAGGSTNAGAGIELAYKMATKSFKKDGINRVILATDGDFNVGQTSQSSLINLIQSKAKDNIFLTVLGFGMFHNDSMLENLSNKGNGNYAYIDSFMEARKVFEQDLEKNLVTVAKDVKIQVEFNPALVHSYKLIGYENRKLDKQDFVDDKKDAGEIGLGHTVTALYEVELKADMKSSGKIIKSKYTKTKVLDSSELLNVKVRYKKPRGEKSILLTKALKNRKNSFNEMDSDFRFASAVAGLGLYLRNDKYIKNISLEKIKEIAKESNPENNEFRTEFINLISMLDVDND